MSKRPSTLWTFLYLFGWAFITLGLAYEAPTFGAEAFTTGLMVFILGVMLEKGGSYQGPITKKNQDGIPIFELEEES
jgi:hypothetical protein